ncbi:hypothetical protein NMG60_11009561 [Bertholletia excelsa]
MVRLPCDKLNVRRGHWTEEEDAKMLAYVSKHGTGNWTALPKKAGLRRCGKSCRLRWTNHLRPDLRRESFTPQEEELIIRLHAAIGNRWSMIAPQLPGRTDNDVKNYWNTKLRKKLTEMGIDPVTHKPFSQIIADYGSIGGLPRSATRTRSLTRDLKEALASKSSDQALVPAEGLIPTYPIPETAMAIENTTNNSLDLLVQLQAITLVAEASNGTSHEIHTPRSDSSTSSSSPLLVSAELDSTPEFNWQYFLVEDPILPVEIAQENTREEDKQDSSASEEMEEKLPINSLEAPSSSGSSFLEAMIDQQNSMLLEFPGLLEEPFFM